jgi:cell division protein FtsW (lipid II flippase)
VALAGLLAIDFSPLGTDLGSGTRRWLKLGPLPGAAVFRTGEIALIGVLADFWSRAARSAQTALWPWLVAGALTLPVIALVFVQPHSSAACLLALLPLAIAFYADVHQAVLLSPARCAWFWEPVSSASCKDAPPREAARPA